jgi:hypothetical protein
MSLLLALRSHAEGTVGRTVAPAVDEAEALARRHGMAQVAPHMVHEVHTYAPEVPGGAHVLALRNPDTGLVDIAAHEDPAEALRLLAERFADDL